MRPRARRNPSGFLGTGIELPDIALLGVGAWLVLSPPGKLLLSSLFSGGASVDEGPPGFGNSSGAVPGEPGSVYVAKQSKFRIAKVDFSRVTRPGASIDVSWTIDYQGPGGAFVVGFANGASELGGFLCKFGQHAQPIHSEETDLEVTPTGTWETYTGAMTVSYIGQGFALLDVQLYVRDSRGRVLADSWGCGEIGVSPF